MGYFLRAHEKQPTNEQGGYSFAAYSPVDPFYALGVLRDKIRRGLATRYIVLEQGKHSLSHDKLIGHVDFGGVVVDGEFLSFEEFYSILQAYEGFQFSLKIADPYDEL